MQDRRPRLIWSFRMVYVPVIIAVAGISGSVYPYHHVRTGQAIRLAHEKNLVFLQIPFTQSGTVAPLPDNEKPVTVLP